MNLTQKCYSNCILFNGGNTQNQNEKNFFCVTFSTQSNSILFTIKLLCFEVFIDKVIVK